VKAENLPRIGEAVVDQDMKPIGKVFDILGPTSSPYVAVKPAVQHPEKFADKTLYAVPSERRKEKGLNEQARRRT
jgi:rRNA processing protein Gar1